MCVCVCVCAVVRVSLCECLCQWSCLWPTRALVLQALAWEVQAVDRVMRPGQRKQVPPSPPPAAFLAADSSVAGVRVALRVAGDDGARDALCSRSISMTARSSSSKPSCRSSCCCLLELQRRFSSRRQNFSVLENAGSRCCKNHLTVAHLQPAAPQLRERCCPRIIQSHPLRNHAFSNARTCRKNIHATPTTTQAPSHPLLQMYRPRRCRHCMQLRANRTCCHLLNQTNT